MASQLSFVPQFVGSYWRGGKKTAVQLDVVAAAPREKRRLIGEAKWEREKLSRTILTELIQRNQRMPQVAAGWSVEYMLFAQEGFSDALKQEAQKQKVTLVSLKQLEQALSEGVGKTE